MPRIEAAFSRSLATLTELLVLGFAPPAAAERERLADRAVSLFLHGYRDEGARSTA